MPDTEQGRWRVHGSPIPVVRAPSGRTVVASLIGVTDGDYRALVDLVRGQDDQGMSPTEITSVVNSGGTVQALTSSGEWMQVMERDAERFGTWGLRIVARIVEPTTTKVPAKDLLKMDPKPKKVNDKVVSRIYAECETGSGTLLAVRVVVEIGLYHYYAPNTLVEVPGDVIVGLVSR